MTLTHDDLVKRAKRWLLNTVGCSFALVELRTLAPEVPDAIGFKETRSFLVECKTSRSDFLADKAKPFRQWPEVGMGNYRFYMAPPGLIRIDELPKHWGLLEVHERVVRIAHPATGFNKRGGNIHQPPAFSGESVILNERPMLISALRRVALRGDLEKIYENPHQKRAS